MILTITFDNPVTLPECGFKVLYRAKGASSYTTIETSGTPSGTTVTASIEAPVCIEGYSQADCCNEQLSTTDPFGVNAYSQVTIDSIEVTNEPDLHYVVNISSLYANPYNTFIAGIFHTDAGSGSTLSYEVIYSSGTTSQTIAIVSPVPDSLNETISDITIDNIAPEFYGNGGQLQLFDPIATPEYFQFIATSGSTWDGSPTSLPSFTLDEFNVTETDVDSNVTSGNLLVSWIYDTMASGGTTPYDTVTFEVYDLNSDLIGSITTIVTPLGARYLTIALNKASVDLNDSNIFTMVTKWDNGAIITTKEFYLPSPTF